MTTPALLRAASLRGRLLSRDEWYEYRESYKCRLVAQLGCPLLMCWPEHRDDTTALLSLVRAAFEHAQAPFRGITSIGCGCGVVEWLLTEYTHVHGVDACL